MKNESMDKIHLIIAGTFKSGTSSLFTYLNQIDSIRGSSMKETGFFVPAKYEEPVGEHSKYISLFHSRSSHDYLMEASPGYLYGGRKIAKIIHERLGEQTKIIFLLRNPVDRFISFFKMLSHENVVTVPTDISNQKLSLSQYIKACENYNGNNDISKEKMDYVYNGLTDGEYINNLREWFEVFDQKNIQIIFFDDLTQQPKETCSKILNWLSINDNALEKVSFRPVNKFRESKSKTVHRFAMKINKGFESFLRKNEKLKQRIVKIYERVNTTQGTEGRNLYRNEKQYLEEYYSPHNKNLILFLREKGYSGQPDWLK